VYGVYGGEDAEGDECGYEVLWARKREEWGEEVFEALPVGGAEHQLEYADLPGAGQYQGVAGDLHIGNPAQG